MGASTSPAPDSYVELDGRISPVEIKAKRSVDAASARLLADGSASSPAGLLVVAGRTTTAARETMEAANVSYVDESGHAFLRFPGIYVRIGPSDSSRKPAATGSPNPIRLAGRASVVAQAMLLEPDREWSITDLSRRSGASAGLTHRVVRRLEEQSLVAATGTGPHRRRRLAKPAALLDLLAEEDPGKDQRRLAGFALDDSDQRHLRVSERLGEAGIHYALTGAFAASFVAPTLTAVPVAEVRITSEVLLEHALEALEASPVDEGPNLVLRQSAGDTGLSLSEMMKGIWFAAPTRIYLDTLHDERRGQEAAEAYRRSVLGY